MPFVSCTMKEVADRAGVHPATVSRALRHDARITPGQRKKILQLAKEMGYRKNPLIAALMSARRTGRPSTHHATLAFITHYPAERRAFFQNEFGHLLAGARDRAQAQSYRIEEINIHPPSLTTARITDILHSRGIHGAVVAPLHSIHETFRFDWTQFSAVAIGFSFQRLPVNRVAHNHYNGLSSAVHACRAAGRTRLGLVVPQRVHEKVEKRWLAAMLVDQAETPGEHVPPLVLAEGAEEAFFDWFHRHRPEALLGPHPVRLKEWLQQIGGGARTTAIVSLDRRPRDRGVAGINQNYPQIGATAVDTVIGMLNRNEQGLPANPATLLIDGTWVPAGSLRPLT